MFYNLLAPLTKDYHFANLFHYVTFRCALAFCICLVLSIILGKKLINFLNNIQVSQPIRATGPKTHLSKVGTPSMGGIIITIVALSISFLVCKTDNIYLWIIYLITTLYATIGFYDDFLKMKHKTHKGLSAQRKMILQIFSATIAVLALEFFSPNDYKNILYFPFLKNFRIDMGYFYMPFAIFIIVGAANAVNLTDGLDGLAIGPIITTIFCLGIISYLTGNFSYAEYLHLRYIQNTSEITIFTSAIIGSSLGFLWYNAKPAQIFMGDTGSLALGAILGTISVIIKQEILLAIIGMIFVIETFSVILQVTYFKFTKGKRLFRMSPLHHHFEQLGLEENKVVVRFWIISLVFAIIGLTSLKVR